MPITSTISEERSEARGGAGQGAETRGCASYIAIPAWRPLARGLAVAGRAAGDRACGLRQLDPPRHRTRRARDDCGPAHARGYAGKPPADFHEGLLVAGGARPPVPAAGAALVSRSACHFRQRNESGGRSRAEPPAACPECLAG